MNFILVKVVESLIYLYFILLRNLPSFEVGNFRDLLKFRTNIWDSYFRSFQQFSVIES